MKIDRRKFLAGLGACVSGGAVGTLLSPLPWKVMDDVAIWTQSWPWTPVPQDGPYTYVSSVCTLCPGGCGISVRKVQNRAVKIEGLMDYPVGNGRLCPLGLSGLQFLYGPARVKSPLKRIGKRGNGKWQPVSWDAAISEIAQKLTDLRANDKPHTVAWISGEKNGTIAALIARFLTVYGSPNLLQQTTDQDAIDQAAYRTQGRHGTVLWDIENADFILSFGAGLLDGWGTPSYMDGFLGNADGNKTLIQIEPRLSDTAAKASQWIAVNPGTEGALAMGITHIIIRELLYNINFVNNHTFGFDDVIDGKGQVTQGFKSMVLKKYQPGKVSEITGVPVDTIFDIARRFAKAEKPIAISGRGRGMVSGSMDEALAIVYLNVLMANIDQPGGVFVVGQPDYVRFPEPILDKTAEKGIAQPRVDGAGSDKFPNARHLLHRLPEIILSANDENPVEALLVTGANPLYTMPDAKAVQKSFDKIPFVVSFSPYMDETAAYSDLILPDHTYLECYRDVVSQQSAAGAVISLAKPVVHPLYNTRHLGDVVIQLARSIGGSVKNTFAWENYESILKEIFSDNWKELTTRGFIKVAHQDLKTSAHAFNTASKKFEFQLNSAAQAEPSPAAFVPSGMEGDPRQFPLMLIPYDSIRIAGSHMANPPFMTKTIDDTVLKKTYSLIEINPATAKQMHLAEGDLVKLSTPKGEADVKIHLYEGVMPGVIAMPRGLGHTAYAEEWGLSGKGVNVNDLMGYVEDPVSGLDMAWGIRAKLTKV
jgi:menaquinone reductase, molybdopterin-binding-like subunit